MVYAHIICPWLVQKTTNVPVVYMGLVLSGFEGGLSITRGILGRGPKNRDFLGPEMARA